jgi:hypothetical protein
MPVSHAQVRRGNKRYQLRGVRRRTTKARLHMAERALNHLVRGFDLGAHQRFGFLDFALGFLQSAVPTRLIVFNATGSYLSDQHMAFMF